MAINRHIAAELVRAFAVLALVFLSFGHQPAAATAHDHDVLTAAVTASFCGGAPADTTHAACHACRIGNGADLPPPPCVAISAPVAAAPVSYFDTTVRPPTVAASSSAQPRAPPALV